ncbi:hypothetical protein [Pseudomonas bharatica]|uniref:hypothetical protein n=1 Tax=Pseudomonas TaxID=286 RepID=UPI003B28D7B1
MANSKHTGAAPDQQMPGEVERDNDARRPDEPGHGKRDSTAQEHAKSHSGAPGKSSG